MTDKAILIFEDCEKDLKNQKDKKFKLKAVSDGNGDYNAHGLLFAVALILEHESTKDRKIHLPYKRARDIYNDFDGVESEHIKNSRILAQMFADKINEV